MTEVYFRIALAIFDGVAGLILAYALTTRTLLDFPKSHRFFISIGAAGLLSQSILTVARLEGYPVAEFWWTWAGKDICIVGLTLTYTFIGLRARSRTGSD